MPTSFLKWNLLITDIGFILYWTIAALNILPPAWMYKDFQNPILFAWNWSFAPLDVVASGLGIFSLWLARKGSSNWNLLAFVSICMTFCAGLMAISFWVIRQDFELLWWLPNLYLIFWPVIYVISITRKSKSA
jgi:hypothetical protein